jgi:hypothetical protein
VTGVSILFGFGTTLAAAKKKDPHFFDQGLTGRIEKPTTEPISSEAATAVRRRVPVSISSVEPGASLAIRALGWGTLYAVTGCSVLFYGIWKLMAVNDVSIMLSTTTGNSKQKNTTLTFCRAREFSPKFQLLIGLFMFSNFLFSQWIIAFVRGLSL